MTDHPELDWLQREHPRVWADLMALRLQGYVRVVSLSGAARIRMDVLTTPPRFESWTALVVVGMRGAATGAFRSYHPALKATVALPIEDVDRLSVPRLTLFMPTPAIQPTASGWASSWRRALTDIGLVPTASTATLP